MTKHIKVLRGCSASGVALAAGAVYRVPGEVSEADARLLLQLGKAVPHLMARDPAPDPAPVRGGKARK